MQYRVPVPVLYGYRYCTYFKVCTLQRAFLALLQSCCEPVHTAAKQAATPEAALRSRFSAFAQGLEQFIADTTHPDCRLCTGAYACMTPDNRFLVRLPLSTVESGAPSNIPVPIFIDLAFHYDGKSAEDAKAQYLLDIKTGCTMFDYQELSIKKSEPGVSEDEGLVAFSYRSCLKIAEGEKQGVAADQVGCPSLAANKCVVCRYRYAYCTALPCPLVLRAALHPAAGMEDNH